MYSVDRREYAFATELCTRRAYGGAGSRTSTWSLRPRNSQQSCADNAHYVRRNMACPHWMRIRRIRLLPSLAAREALSRAIAGPAGGKRNDHGAVQKRAGASAMVTNPRLLARMTIELPMNGGGERPWLHVHESASELPTAAFVVRLRTVFGAKLVAYIANLNSTGDVRGWADGTARPDLGSEARLRIAVEALITPSAGC